MRYEISSDILTSIADSIREKTGKSALIKPEDMATEILSISTDEIHVPQAIYNYYSYVGGDVRVYINPSTKFVNVSTEYDGNVYGNTNMINALGLVLIGDYRNGTNATGNVLSDSLDNYGAIIINGVYTSSADGAGQPTSYYNTSMLYVPELNKTFWTGMKDRNPTHDCRVTFTDSTHFNASGSSGYRRCIIYGVPNEVS